jgi:putative oxidoreductase
MKTSRSLVVVRCLLGAAFVLFGLDGFFHFIPIPPARPAAAQMIGALVRTGYFFQMVKAIETACGALLLANRLVPLALVLLAPLLVGITSIHLFLNPEGLPLMAVLLLMHGLLVRGYWEYLGPVLTARAALAPRRS